MSKRPSVKKPRPASDAGNKAGATVSDLLKASLAAHLAAKEQTSGKGVNRVVIKESDLGKYREALSLRMQALELDPTRQDAAWDRAPFHEQMMGFYRDKGLA